MNLETGGDPTIDIERMAVDEGRSVAGQEDGGADQFVDVSPTAGRRPLFEPAREFWIVDQRLVERGLEVTRRDRIDLQPISGQSAHIPRVRFFTAPFVAV